MAVLCLLILLSGVNGYGSYKKNDLSLSLPYETSGWYFYGSTSIEAEYVRLTRDVKSQSGGLYCTTPVTFRDWEIHITFHIHSEGKTLVGDGFAFWYTQTPASYGNAFGSHEKFRGLGLFFDTYANQNGEHSHQHPYISAMVNDGSKTYDHDRDGTLTELAGCSTDFRNKNYATAILRFVREELSLVIKYANSEKVVECFKVSDVHLPTGYYIGLSAATGDLSDTHDIIGVKTFEVDAERPASEYEMESSLIEPSAGQASPDRDRIPDSPPASRTSRFFWSLFYWLFVLGGLSGCCYVAYLFYVRRKRQFKRLY